MTTLEILKRQQAIADKIAQLKTNFKKDSASRKTSEYLTKRLETLETLWNEFHGNNETLLKSADTSIWADAYFTSDTYTRMKREYEGLQGELKSCQPVTTEDKNMPSKTEELLSLQRTNFRALARMVNGLRIQKMSEKWELDDKLNMLQQRWRVIDETHWKLDNLLAGTDLDYEEEFSEQEVVYESIKAQLNQKLNASAHQYQAIPKIEIPVFTGNYTQWPTFLDLYSEAVHNNNLITKAQKMQHLKGKLRGEAERIVQHLTVSAENYDTCWQLLTHRYNNIQVLFTKQMQTFLNQPTIQQQSTYELKRLHDTSLETIYAIRNLGVDTATWAPILVHILVNKLDPDTYASYMEARKAPRELPEWGEFVEFLESKFTALETVNKKKQPSLPKHTSGPQKEVPSTTPKEGHYQYKFKRQSPKIAYHAKARQNFACPVCKEKHIIIYCSMFIKMTKEAKLRTISQLDICSNCLYSHNGVQCHSAKRCKICEAKHHTGLHELLCDSAHVGNMGSTPSTSNQVISNKDIVGSQRIANHVAGNFNEILLATLQVKVKAADGTYIQLRCLLDQGSQINLITEAAAQRLGLKRRNQSATVSGIGSSSSQSKGALQLTIGSMYGDHELNTEAIVMTKMLNSLPNYTFEKQQWPHLQGINLADPDYNVSRPVDILLDAGVYADIIMDGILRGSSQAPIAQQTRLGWVLLGNVKSFNCHAVLNNINDIAQFWESEEIMESSSDKPAEESFCENLYAETTRRLVDGRYEVTIPMKPNFEQQLGKSRPQAVAQFLQLEKRLAKDEVLAKRYKEFMAEYIELEHMKECTLPQEPSCYLPHHGVIRLDSLTTKLRTVFNASNPTNTGCSLNQLMESGPNLQQDLQAMILRWRTFRYVYTADIEKFYRQIRIREQDQHLQKIVWRATDAEPIKTYQLCTVTYGTKAAPFLAMRTIKQLIKDDGPFYPLAANILNHQLYVDDLLGGSNSIEEGKTAQTQLINLLHGGGFNLRKWASNHPALLEDLEQNKISQNMLDLKSTETNKTLGIAWNPRTDCFTFKTIAMDKSHDVTTKRTLLSDLSKLYDPLGWLSPVTMKGKLTFQQVWAQEINWDDPIPHHLQKDWEAFRNDLDVITEFKIPRWIGGEQKQIELYGFCDASEKGYACVIYVKGRDETGRSTTKLLAGKTKLAPINKCISLPRLELCGALLLSRLIKKTIESLNEQNVRIYGWTDSTVVLGWLQGDISRWKSFVANRVGTITQIMPPSCWRHVRSEDNPADSASRGLLPSQLLEHPLWWQGPRWLKDFADMPNKLESYEEPTEERKSNKQTCVTQTSSTIVEELLVNHSSMTCVTRILAWIQRFVNNALNKKRSQTQHLTTNELSHAHDTIIKTVQNKYFSDEIAQLRQHKTISSKSRILNLNPILNKQAVLLVGGRLQQSTLKTTQKHPIILPSKSKLTELLINQAHAATLHGGPRLTLAVLRDRYWILQGTRTVKDQLRRCVTCHRFKMTSNNQLMASLPSPRVTPSRPFTHTGVDFTGQVEVKANKGRGIKTTKGYIAVFICMVTKAIHLELVSDLSTDTFLAALRRLCSRRGCPKHLYSDNGTNFVGAARILKRQTEEALHWYATPEMKATLTNIGIDWHFNAPAWASAGGLWERAVRSTKHHLRRVLGEQKLTYEEFATLLTQIEACLNSRPLTPLTEDVDDLDCLTPGHFLVGEPVLASPLCPDKEPTNLRDRWQLTEKIHKDFWKKWSSEYLQTLQPRNKWHTVKPDLKVGDMVLLRDDNIPPARWLLGRITGTHPGKDGHVRVVSLKTKTGQLKRPVTKLSKLPIDEEHIDLDHPNRADEQPTTRTRNRPGRKISNVYFVSLFALLAIFTPVASQQGTSVTDLNPSRLIYFDKVADLQVIQDEWKMVVYYNMTTYWQGFKSMEKFAAYLIKLCMQETSFTTIATQVQHEVNEMQHFNNILMSEHGANNRRKARGLIDGVGYIANSLFGVLDQRFAQQYEKDINTIQANENHLLNLFKNHTSILEGEYNLLQRNEKVMNQQFSKMHEYLADQAEQTRINNNNMMQITATALAAKMIMDNLRRVQLMLLDLITDAKDSHVDVHLLKPDQFEEQLNIIAGQLPRDLALPCVNTHHCIREMYKLARVHVHLTNTFLIFEIKLPLVNNEPYELNKIIPIPRVSKGSLQQIKPTSEYMAINLKKDMVIPLTSDEIASCIHVKEHQLLCNLNLPVYNTKVDGSICEAQIINNNNISNCKTITSDCSNRWIQLHNKGAWLFACCEECAARAFCAGGVTSVTLHGTGIIRLEPGCMLKGTNVILHSPNNFRSETTVNEDFVYAPESAINHVLEESTFTFTPEDHREALEVLKTNIQNVKAQQDELTDITSTHSTHHYTSYSFMSICIILAVAWGVHYLRRRLQPKRSPQPMNTTTKDNLPPETSASSSAAAPPPQEDTISINSAPRHVHKATSP